jgi:hypothetical protein
MSLRGMLNFFLLERSLLVIFLPFHSITLPLDMSVKPIEAKHVPKSELDTVAAQLAQYPIGDVLLLWDQRIPIPSAFVQLHSAEFSSLFPASEHHVVHRSCRLTLRFGSIFGSPVVLSVLPVSIPGCSIRVGKELAAVVRACSLAGCKRVISFTIGEIMIPNPGYVAAKYSSSPSFFFVAFIIQSLSFFCHLSYESLAEII